MVAICFTHTIMTTHKYLTAFSFALITTGATIGAPAGLSHFSTLQPVTSETLVTQSAPSSHVSTKENPVVEGTPRHISIPSIGIDATVEDGYYNSKTRQWTLSEDSAFFATPTDKANSKQGNTFIYGHNSNKIFGKLPHMKTGALAKVTTDTGAQFVYTFTSTEAVRPTETGILQYSGTPRLMLQTCGGAWNQDREIFYFSLTSFTK